MKLHKVTKISVEILDQGYVIDLWGETAEGKFVTYKTALEHKADVKEELKDLLKSF